MHRDEDVGGDWSSGAVVGYQRRRSTNDHSKLSSLKDSNYSLLED
jgi:hypothetical protein